MFYKGQLLYQTREPRWPYIAHLISCKFMVTSSKSRWNLTSWKLNSHNLDLFVLHTSSFKYIRRFLTSHCTAALARQKHGSNSLNQGPCLKSVQNDLIRLKTEDSPQIVATEREGERKGRKEREKVDPIVHTMSNTSATVNSRGQLSDQANVIWPSPR